MINTIDDKIPSEKYNINMINVNQHENGRCYAVLRQNVVQHITQIAAIERETGSQFSYYVIPKTPISPEAEEITGIVWDGTNLRIEGKVVTAEQISKAISNFFVWLQKFENAVLVAYYGKKFYYRFLSKVNSNANQYSQDEVLSCVLHFEKTPNRKVVRFVNTFHNGLNNPNEQPSLAFSFNHNMDGVDVNYMMCGIYEEKRKIKSCGKEL
ncbi:unnamed protein product [Mytilus coruscus]|uniref:Uncharacterized protein n=1 Tax=Mytilus coruscus TaxID=42192 RepID=A0A6J8DCI3_MYTCO|nr:unnamed protein product [Mytilus coruscus]